MHCLLCTQPYVPNPNCIPSRSLKQAEKIEKVGLVYLKEGLKIAADHPEAAQAGGAASLVLLLPFTRRALTRSVIRMFRSEEAQFRSAEHKVDALSKRLEELKGESHKLKERYVIAETELLSGRKKASLGLNRWSVRHLGYDLILEFLRYYVSKSSLDVCSRRLRSFLVLGISYKV